MHTDTVVPSALAASPVSWRNDSSALDSWAASPSRFASTAALDSRNRPASDRSIGVNDAASECNDPWIASKRATALAASPSCAARQERHRDSLTRSASPPGRSTSDEDGDEGPSPHAPRRPAISNAPATTPSRRRAAPLRLRVQGEQRPFPAIRRTIGRSWLSAPTGRHGASRPAGST